MSVLDEILENKENVEILTEYSTLLTNNNLKISNDTFKFFGTFSFDDLQAILNKNVETIALMAKQGKSNEYIQNFLDSDFYVISFYSPSYIKEDKELQKAIIKGYQNKSLKERINILNLLKEMSQDETMTMQDKQLILKICLNNKSLLQDKKLSLILRGLPASNLVALQNDLNSKKTRNEESAYLRKVLEQRKKILKKNEELEKKNKEKIKDAKNVDNNNDKNYHLYNQEYYDFIKDKKLSMDKIDIIHKAYFQNGINLDDFKKDLGNDLYNCSRDQLDNYVTVFTRYNDGFLTSEEYDFSKNIIDDNHITQKEIKEDVLPIIENYNLTERHIKECIDMGAKREVGDCRKFLDLAIEAKERNYSNFEINELLDDCKEKNTRNAEFKTKMIKEYGKCNLTEVDKLNEYTNKQMEILLKERELALELKGLPEFEVSEINFDLK